MTTMVSNTPSVASFHSPRYFRFSMPGSLPTQEELEEVPSRGSTTSIASSSTTTKYSSSKMLRPEAASSAGKSGKSVFNRIYSEGETPTGSIGTLTNDRESMRTPRPRIEESPKSKRIPLPELTDYPAAFVKNRKEASDATLDGNATAQQMMNYRLNEERQQREQSKGYPSDSLGKVSIASSNYGNRSGSEAGGEFGEKSSSSANRKSRKKPIAPPELLVIVRPPPSKQANPLNLQIQLVIPQTTTTANTASRTSFDSSRDDPSITASQSSGSNGGHNGGGSIGLSTTTPSMGIRRSASISSSYSARSEASSGAQSSLSSSSTGRRVTPLYNLNFHNITATTVTDAGTDDKVAKFGKKAVEIDGFGQLEPHELMIGVNDLSTLQARRRSSTKGTLPALTAISSNSGSDFNSPDALSDVSHAKSTDITQPPSRTSDIGAIRPFQEPPTSFDAMSPEARNPGEGGLGGKLFNKFKRFSLGASANAQAKLNAMGAPSIRSSVALDSSASTTAPTSLLAKMTNKGNVEGVGEDSEVMSARESVAGLSLGHSLGFDIPQLIAGGGLRSDGRKTEGYYWTVRKWNRRTAQEEGEDQEVLKYEEAGSNPILNSVWKRFNIANRMGGQEIHPPCKDVPVRFEWTRNTGFTQQRRKSSAVGSHTRSATDVNMRGSRNSRLSVSKATRPSMDVETNEIEKGNLKLPKGLARSNSSRPSSVYSNHSPRRSVDAASQNGSHVGSVDNGEEESDPEDSETTWACHLVLGPATRIPIGSLSPTPHHPKLVGQLTIPFPLPDLSQSGLGADGAGLTREELKDIISVTCLFVIVREGFGGLVKKKGAVASKS